MNKGFMIALDGGNGAGKSSIIAAVGSHLLSKGHEVVFSREPGGTAIGEKLREFVLSPDFPEMQDVTEALIFAAARAQHVRELIAPSVEAGKIVICDRFAASGISFQHYARGISLDLVSTLNDIALGGFQCDLNIILDIDPELGAQRVKSRGEKLDRLELAKIEFHKKAREGYLRQAEASPATFRVIDASKSEAEVLLDAIEAVEQVMTSN